MNVVEMIDEITRLVDHNAISAYSEVKVLVSEEYLQRPVDRIEVQVTQDLPILVLRTPEAS